MLICLFFRSNCRDAGGGFPGVQVCCWLQTKSGGSGGDEWWGFVDLDSTGFGYRQPSSINHYNMPSALVYGASLSIEPRRGC
jgi:hypothetical protein